MGPVNPGPVLQEATKMNAPTQEIKLPLSEVTVFLRKWITNEQADYAEEPVLDAVQMRSGNLSAGEKPEISLGNYDTKNAVHIGDRRRRQVYVEKIVEGTGETAKTISGEQEILDYLKALPSTDIEFLDIKIRNTEAENKKKLQDLTTSEPTPTAA